MIGRAFYSLLGITLIYTGVKSVGSFARSLRKEKERGDLNPLEGLLWDLGMFLPEWRARDGSVLGAIGGVIGILIGLLFLAVALLTER